jgi:hypothetical protein
MFFQSLIQYKKPLVCFNRPLYSMGLRGKEVVKATKQAPLQIDIDEKPGELRLLHRLGPLTVRERPTSLIRIFSLTENLVFCWIHARGFIEPTHARFSSNPLSIHPNQSTKTSPQVIPRQPLHQLPPLFL